MLLNLLSEKSALTGLYEKVQSGHFFHAVIFEGTQAEQAAQEYACACVCAQTPPCGQCPGCKKVLNQIHPDVYYAEGTGASRSIPVDTVRFIRDDAFKKPNEAPRKVYILKKSEDMTPEAQNALLKVLEEPPANVVFILTCQNAHDLLPTVLSRCQLYSLQQTGEDPQALQAAQAFAFALIDAGEMEFLALSAPWISDKEFFIRVTGQLLQLLRDALVYRSCGQSVEEAAERLGDNLTEERLLHLYKLTEEIQQKADHKKLALNQSLLVSSYFAAARGIRYGALI